MHMVPVSTWIRDEPSRFNIFVANRVAAIQELTESVDPADILSRGAFPAELNESPLWAHGPKFLCGPKLTGRPQSLLKRRLRFAGGFY